MSRQEHKDIYEVVGAAQEVHKTLGRGMNERIYQEALAVEMKQRGLDFERISVGKKIIHIILISFSKKTRDISFN